MPSVTIDTCVLAVPPSSVSHDEIVEYVETLLDWGKLLRKNWVEIYMSERASDVMFMEEVFPIRDGLKKLFAAKGFEDYDANTVCTVVGRLLELTPSFETYFCLDLEASSVTTEPDLLAVHTRQELMNDLARCAVIIAILRSHCKSPVLDHSLIVKRWQGSTSVHVHAQIAQIAAIRDDLLPVPVEPEFFEGEILTCQNFRELVLNLDEVAIWKAADSVIGLELATKIAVYKYRIERAIAPDWDSIQGFRFGCEFYQRMRACEQGGSPGLVDRTLRSLAETIDKQKMRDVHEKRTGMGGGDPQETRGQDKAWRRDIDREYHLHYWECADGTIEFASVGPHNMFDIPKCS